MAKIKRIKDLSTVQSQSCTNCAKPSKEPNDSYLIERGPNDSFSSERTARYGEEQDVYDS